MRHVTRVLPSGCDVALQVVAFIVYENIVRDAGHGIKLRVTGELCHDEYLRVGGCRRAGAGGRLGCGGPAGGGAPCMVPCPLMRLVDPPAPSPRISPDKSRYMHAHMHSSCFPFHTFTSTHAHT